MARVYEGRLDSLAGVSTRVAVKVVHPDYAAEPSFRDLFITEARISARLEHPNLVRIQQFNREGELYYLVMELIEGVTFRRVISMAQRGRFVLTPTVVAELGRQAAEGLHYTHELRDDDGIPLRLVHRDVKPSNLMLNVQGVVKLLDFGISTAIGVGSPAEGEGRGPVRGTWGYMSPEQATGGEVGPAADNFGLAAVLFELAAGELLFEESDPARIRAQLWEDHAARRAAALGGPWRELGAILVRALQRDPAARYPSAAAMAKALAGLVREPLVVKESLLEVAAGCVDLESPPPAPVERSRSVSTMQARPSEPQGLPVAVGDDHGPHPRTAPSRKTSAPTRGNHAASFAILGVLLVALGVTAAIAWMMAEGGLRAVFLPEPEPPMLPAGTIEPEPAEVPPAAAVPLEAPPAEPSGAEPGAADPSSVAPLAPAGAVPGGQGGAPPAGGAVEPARSAAAAASPTASSASAGAAGPAAPTRAPSPGPAPSAAGGGAPASQGTGLVTISSVPRAQVLLDGTLVDYTPYFQAPAAVGSHTVVLVADDGRRKSFRIEVVEGQEVRRVWLFDEERWGER